MANLIEFDSVCIGPRRMRAELHLAEDCPELTSEAPEAVDRLLDLIPELQDHACTGEGADTFGQSIVKTEWAHVLEHVAIELLSRTGDGEGELSGRTRRLSERQYQLELDCPDDVLCTGALSSAAWILQWALSGADAPGPDVEAIVTGLNQLVEAVGN